MITVTIGEIISGSAAYHPGPCVYRVRAGDIVLYVGKATHSAADRMLEHLGLQGPGGGSALGDLITDNLPDSKAWQVDILTLEDCRTAMAKHFPYLADQIAARDELWDSLFGLDRAEQALIFECGPCLNVTHNRSNPNRQPLPDKYIKHRLANDGVKLG